MASLSNINGLFDVHSTGAILFSTSHGTSGQILRSNGNAAPTWVAASTVIGGPYLPLAGGTLTGATATASGISFTVGGTLSGTSAIFNTGAGDVGLGVYTSAISTTPNVRFGRNSGEYIGFKIEDRDNRIVFRQDETTGNHEAVFDIWSSTSGNRAFVFGVSNNAGASFSNWLTIENGAASFTGSVTAPTFTGALTGTASQSKKINGISRTAITVGGNASTYYPVALTTGAGSTYMQYSEFVIERGGYDDPGYTGIGFSTLNARFSYKPSGWGYGAVNSSLEMMGQTAQMVANYQDYYHASQMIIWLRGATKYFIWPVVGSTSVIFENTGGTDYVGTYTTFTPTTVVSAIASYTRNFYGSLRTDSNFASGGSITSGSGITSGGNVNITGGTTNGLNITTSGTQDTININRAANNDNAITKYQTASADKWIVGLRNTGDDKFRFYSYGTSSDVLTINQSNGNVGIGTDSPAYKLQVAGSSTIHPGNKFGWLYQPGVNNTMYNWIQTSISPGQSYAAQPLEISGSRWTNGNTRGVIFTHQTGGEIMTIMTGGNVGIGATGPTQPLEILAAGGYDKSSSGGQTTNGILIKGGATVGDQNTTGGIGFSFTTGTAGISGYQNGSDQDRVGLSFYTHGSGTGSGASQETMRIKSGGEVGIGTTNPGAKLEVNGDVLLTYLKATGNSVIGGTSINSSRLSVQDSKNGTANSPHLQILGNGYSAYHYLDTTAYNIVTNSTSRQIKIIAQNGGVKLAYAATAWVANSDIALKENIKPLENVLDKIKDYRCVEYNLKESPEDKKIGFVAQDWVDDFPAIVDKDEKDMLGMKYTETIPVLLKAIQELTARIKELENK